MSPRIESPASLSLGLSLLTVACIIPDREIEIEGALPENQAAVRIIERAPLTDQLLEQCRFDPTDPDTPDPNYSFCPQVPNTTLLSGLVRPREGGDFCICPEGDNRALPSFDVYAEDVELDGESPADTLRGVFLLDPVPEDQTDPDEVRPHNDVAFGHYWEPGKAGFQIELSGQAMSSVDVIAPSVGREPVQAYVFPIEDGSGRVDLCNPSSLKAGETMDPGLHNLVFMVSDRPFFMPPHPNEEGQFLTVQNGVPDLAAGASYDTTNYVFRCVDPAADPNANCDCKMP